MQLLLHATVALNRTKICAHFAGYHWQPTAHVLKVWQPSVGLTQHMLLEMQAGMETETREGMALIDQTMWLQTEAQTGKLCIYSVACFTGSMQRTACMHSV